ncbi:MAG: dockerin type I domain-containing protein [Chloroflexota bacterium]|nr:dockerin type I domain-containing protein [Chloroflexota bacterium]
MIIRRTLMVSLMVAILLAGFSVGSGDVFAIQTDHDHGEEIIYHHDHGVGIWKMNSESFSTIQLSDHGWFAEYSPDGSRIAFGEYYSNGIWVMNADGTGQEQLTESGGAPTWSPDGSQIAYHDGTTSGTTRSIWIMNSDGTDAYELTDQPSSFPKWSPDGDKIAYHGEVNNGIWLINPDGTGEVQLYAGGGYPSWSPDSKEIAYVSLTDWCVWKMQSDGTGMIKLTDHMGMAPDWCPHGEHIAYEDLSNDKGLWVVNANGTDDHMINEEGHAPDWAPSHHEHQPDLVITEIWCDAENRRVGYEVSNIGCAMAPAGHYTGLWVEGSMVCIDRVDVDIQTDGTYQTWFQFEWSPDIKSANIEVCADVQTSEPDQVSVDEIDEDNNCMQRTCECALRGDANEDDVVNGQDLVYVKKSILNLESPTPCVDANEDGKVDGLDMIAIKKIILNIGY